jgi:hypothetical protein
MDPRIAELIKTKENLQEITQNKITKRPTWEIIIIELQEPNLEVFGRQAAEMTKIISRRPVYRNINQVAEITKMESRNQFKIFRRQAAEVHMISPRK